MWKRFFCLVLGHPDNWEFILAKHIGYYHGLMRFGVLEQCPYCGEERETLGYAENLGQLAANWDIKISKKRE